MRLTLRTLLAYLDDILEPSQAKEIGARVSENSVASSLVARIRDVMRRRRIGSPELAGPGSAPDPNVVSEYLDNTLEPAVVADVEKVCLESDMHLAEVAACHQILTIVLGEPVTIRPELRERMYALGKPVDAAQAAAVAAAAPATAPAPTPPARPVIPDYLRRPPLWKRLAPWTVIGVALAAWGYLAKDFLFGRGEQTTLASSPQTESSARSAQPLAPEGNTEPEETAQSKSAPAAPAESETQLTAAETPISPQLNPGDEPGQTAIPEATETASSAPTSEGAAAVAAAATSPAADGGAIVPPPPEPGISAPDAAPSELVAAAPAVPAPVVMYTSSEGVLLYRPQGAADWTVLPRRALVHVGDEFACPEPFTAELSVSAKGAAAPAIIAQVPGGGRVTLATPQSGTIAEFDVNRGRLALYRPGDGNDAAKSVGVTVGGERIVLDLTKPETRCGVLVGLPQPDGPPAPEAAFRRTGTLFVTSGAVQLHRGDGVTTTPEAAPEWIEWTNPESKAFVGLGTIPMWLDPDARPTNSARSYARAFEPEFALDQPVTNSIPPVLQDRRPQISRLAAMTLAVVDDPSGLVEALSADHEETRLAAIVGLREWVLLAPENGDRLMQEISRGFRDDEVETVYKLVWGLRPEDANVEATSMELVELMGSDNIAIRELAFFQVHRLTGKDLGYRPLNPQGQREAALSRWRDLVKRNKGLVPKAG